MNLRLRREVEVPARDAGKIRSLYAEHRGVRISRPRSREIRGVNGIGCLLPCFYFLCFFFSSFFMGREMVADSRGT